MTPKQLKSLIKEAIEEVKHEYDEQTEIMLMKQIQSAAHWLKKNPTAQPKDVTHAVDLIVGRIDELLSMHKKEPEKDWGTLNKNLKTHLGLKEGGVIGWEQFLTPKQSQVIDILEKKGWRATNAFPGSPDAEGSMGDETVVVVVQKKVGPVRRSGEVEPDGSVNGQPVEQFLAQNIQEKAPAGWEGTVKAMKKHGDIDNPWALAHWMKGKGMKSHK